MNFIGQFLWLLCARVVRSEHILGRLYRYCKYTENNILRAKLSYLWFTLLYQYRNRSIPSILSHIAQSHPVLGCHCTFECMLAYICQPHIHNYGYKCQFDIQMNATSNSLPQNSFNLAPIQQHSAKV